jgi:hypothetical protein
MDGLLLRRFIPKKLPEEIFTKKQAESRYL